MKQILFLFLLLWGSNITIQAQNDCKYKASVPDELYRGRYKPEGYKYGNPYTMFNKRKPNWSLDDDLSKIRNLILTQVDGNNAYGYAALYKAIYDNADDPEPAACNYDQLGCAYPQWVKQCYSIQVGYRIIITFIL